MRDAHKNPNYDHTHNIGRKTTEETKLKQSLAKKGKSAPHKKVPILQFDLKGNFIKEWDSIKEAQKELNISSSVGSCCSGKLKTAGKFKWKYKNK